MRNKILLVGCGKMGGALINGWLKTGIKAADISVVEPSKQNMQDFTEIGISHFSTFDQLTSNIKPDFVIFAVKPQSMDSVIPSYRGLSQECTYISIAAGKTIAYLEQKLGGNSAIIRAMPNTPAMIQRGATVIFSNKNVNKQGRDDCLRLFRAVGFAKWVADEDTLNLVTAISGSGPAYVYLLAETMRQAGIEFGLEPDMANALATNTIAGSGEMLLDSADDASTLRKNVTSPGGTTEAALSILMGKNGFQQLMTDAVNKAINRSRELGK